jgi:uncharacterized protein (DUF1697 family)
VSKYAAFLRAINLGRNRRVTSAELRSQFEQLGFRDVDTFRTSGNVVFEADREPVAKMTGRIEKGLAASLGYDVGIFLRTTSEIRALAEYQPFPPPLVEASKGKLQVMLLSAKPSAGAQNDVLALATDEDGLVFGDRELFWLPSGGTQDSALDQKAIGELLGSTTMRTKGTIDQLVAKYFSPAA